ncbi:MAG: hypothetical protein JO036_14930 [Candidatus Eremiobacteraeota bacterium]|nr:hypothetical protein [Candidatus Eremiobacteraeota bacterium]
MADSPVDVLRRVAHHRIVLVLWLSLGTVVAARELARSPLFHADRWPIDFHVFWCAGKVTAQHANPYTVEPLRSCEHAQGASGLRMAPNEVIPFVLPAYDLVPFRALAQLPSQFSAAVFSAAAVIALVFGIFLIARTTETPLAASAGALGLSAGLPSLVLGQIVPFELLFMGVAAWALRTNRPRLAGACAALSLAEPHAGVFVVTSLLLFVPRSRPAIAVGVVALFAVWTMQTGLRTELSYPAVLRGQAAAEANFSEQYSATYAATLAGLPKPAALVVGAVSSAALFGLALWLARKLAPAMSAPALVYVPAACAVTSGTYVHLPQIALAVPAALLVLLHARPRGARALGAVAVMLLAVPWPYAIDLKQVLAAALLAVGLVAWYVGGGYRWAAIAVVTCWIVLIPFENRPPAPQPSPRIARAAPNASPTVSWAALVDQVTSRTPRSRGEKAPTWLGLVALLAAAALCASRTRAPMNA